MVLLNVTTNKSVSVEMGKEMNVKNVSAWFTNEWGEQRLYQITANLISVAEISYVVLFHFYGWILFFNLYLFLNSMVGCIVFSFGLFLFCV